MNKKLIMVICAAAMTTSWAVADEKEQVPADKIPHLDKNQLKSYFPDATVVEATKEKSKLKNNYEVKLSDGSVIEFDKDGNWTFVECQGNPLPARMIPGQVHMYMSKNHPGYKVVKMEKDSKRFCTVTLADGTKVLFDDFMKYVSTEKND